MPSVVQSVAERLCRAYPDADAELVRVATLLHDTGWAHVDESRILSEGYRWHGVAAFHFWLSQDQVTPYYDAWKPVAARRRTPFPARSRSPQGGC